MCCYRQVADEASFQLLCFSSIAQAHHTSTMSISVSVIIPTYNRAHLLLVAISSVLAQSRPPQEIIVVDDCSDDGTAEMLERIAHRMQQQGRLATGSGRSGMASDTGSGSRWSGSIGNNTGWRQTVLRVVRLEKHSGYPGRVRNYGITKAKGDYIAFLDDDDQWMPQKLELQVALHAAHFECVISCSDEYWLRLGRMICHPPPGEQTLSFAAALQKCTIGPSTAMIRRECIDPRHGATRGFEPTLELAEDYHLWLRLLDRHQALCLPQKLTLKCEYGQAQLSKKYPYIERFRIDALILLLKRECLRAEHHRAAATVCAAKCRLWSAGARKRGRTAEALRYERMAAYALSAAR